MNTDIYVLIEHLQGQVMDMSYMLVAAGRQMTESTGGQLIALLLGNNADSVANDLAADKVLYIEDPNLEGFNPEAYLMVLAEIMAEKSPRALLLGETSIGADIAGSLSAKLELPLVSLCRDIGPSNDGLRFVSQIYGGKVLAEGQLPEPTAILTLVPGVFKVEAGQSSQTPEMESYPCPSLEGLRIAHKAFIEPETGDVDIAREPILIAVGRGIQQEMNLEIAEELANALGGELCASRPVVDQGWMATDRLVGKSGKTIKPKIYIAIGISGAPEHIEGIGDTDLLIAINTDAQAPIFDLANYGTTADLFELIPVLSEKINQAKGG